MAYRIGVDIGGTNIRAAVIDTDDYSVKCSRRFKTDRLNPDIFLGEIADIINSFKCEYKIESIGIGTPGRLRDDRIVIRAGNIKYSETPVADIIEDKTGIAVYLDNDANCAVYAEKYAGLGKIYDNIILLTVGTGIGGGIMIDKKIYRGKKGRAGELGHFVIDINGKECPCGLRGCFEQYASVTAFVNAARKAAAEHQDSVLYKSVGGDINRIGGRQPFYAMYEGCKIAKSVIEEYEKNLALGINSLYKIFEPEVIVLTGGIVNEGAIITDMLKPHLLADADVRISPLCGISGVVGASCIQNER